MYIDMYHRYVSRYVLQIRVYIRITSCLYRRTQICMNAISISTSTNTYRRSSISMHIDIYQRKIDINVYKYVSMNIYMNVTSISMRVNGTFTSMFTQTRRDVTVRHIDTYQYIISISTCMKNTYQCHVYINLTY